MFLIKLNACIRNSQPLCIWWLQRAAVYRFIQQVAVLLCNALFFFKTKMNNINVHDLFGYQTENQIIVLE